MTLRSLVLFPLSLSILLAACAPAADDDAAVVDVSPAPEAEAPVEASAPVASSFDTTSTVRELMRFMVAPNAERVWDAISYTATAEGTTETMPQTDADWEALRTSAVTLVEAGNALMLAGRAVDVAAPAAAEPGIQYTPAEIADLIRTREDEWVGFLQDMQEYTRQTLESIDARDPLQLTERSAQINQACEGCHAMFWYTPVPMLGNEAVR